MTKYLSLILIILTFSQCSLFDTLGEDVMFLEFESAELTTTSGQGENTHKIQDIHVFVDGFSVGVFNLPAKVPVLSNDSDVRVDVFAVISNNAQRSNPIDYPFYDKVTFDLTFEPLATRALDLNFRYNNDAKVVILADFEGNNPLSVSLPGSTNIDFIRSRETPYGDFCGKLTLPEEVTFYEKTTFGKIPRSVLATNEVYLEIDYKCDIEFGVGLVLETSANGTIPIYKLRLRPQEEWNKVYIQFSQELAIDGIEEFSILLGSGIDDPEDGSIWVDNIKFVHF